MRLLFVHESFGSLGGAEANVFIVATEFKKRGHDVGIVTQKKTGRGEQDWQTLFGREVYLPTSRDEWGKVLETFKPDVLYMHKWEDLESIEGMLRTKLPLVRMVHDHDSYCLRSYKYNPFTRKICTRAAGPYCVFPCLATLKRDRSGALPFKFVSYSAKIRELALNRLFDRHLVVTEYMKNELLINGFGEEQIEIFPPVPRPVEPLQSSFSSRNLLVYAGQLIRGKGVDVLMRALARVQEPFEAVILGDGNHRAACEKLCRNLGLESKVKFLGFVPQAELRNYYANATAVMISSVWPEPIATIGLEVMRYALPVVAFDAGGIRDWLKDGENGFMVPWMDTEAYADRIDRLLRDKDLARRMGRNGLERVSRDYDFEQYIARLEELFGRVGKEPRRRAAVAAEKR